MSLSKENTRKFDAIIVGAGFSGLYMLHRLREAGLSVRVYEQAEGVGGVWYWNRYPGARCDSESIYYNYTFSDELIKEWKWSSRYPEQEEILEYLNFVADKFNLRPDIQFNTRVQSAHYQELTNEWEFILNSGEKVMATYFISAVGNLSTTNVPNFKGLDQFKGDWYHTGNWPKKKVDFSGKRVGVIGTGSSGVQAIPVIAEQAKHLTVFQRTPQYTTPARNRPFTEDEIKKIKENYDEIREQMRNSRGGVPIHRNDKSALEDSPEERWKTFEAAWDIGGFWYLMASYNDLLINEEANKAVSEFVRTKMREVIKDQELARKLMPDYYYATKRPISDTNYLETYNRDNVSLVDVRKAPIQEITAKGVRTSDAEYELDIIVFATGYDAMTGTLFKMDIRGENGVSLKEKWESGSNVKTYLGITTAGFPNYFMITGPQSPSVISNMPVSIEQHVEWIADCINYLQKNQFDKIDATEEAENYWSNHCKEVADATLYPKAESWYTGANIDGKARGFLIYVGGVDVYREICDDIAKKGYEGFTFKSMQNQ